MFVRQRVAPAFASAQVAAYLPTIVVTPLHAQTSTTGNAPQVPAAAHGLNEPYGIRRRWDYFVQYLMGATPPDDYEITRSPDAAGRPGGGSPDDDPSSWR